MGDGKSYFFVGIGGSGMMPLAMILAARGAEVAGSDRALDAGGVPAKFDALAARGIALFPQDGSGVTSAQQIVVAFQDRPGFGRSEEHTSELQSLMRISYAVFCLKKKNNTTSLITQNDKHRLK